ncbi:MAG: hypothetical protein WCX65_13870 [bacterium]
MKAIEAKAKLCPFKLTRDSSDRTIKNCEVEKCMAWVQLPGKEDEGECGMLAKERNI